MSDDLDVRLQMVNRSIDLLATHIEDQWLVLRLLGDTFKTRDSLIGDNVPQSVKDGVPAILRLVELNSLHMRDSDIPNIEYAVADLTNLVSLELERIKRLRVLKTVE